MEILPLLQVPEHHDRVARWLWNEWQDLSDATLEQVRAGLDRQVRPASLLAVEDGEPLGVLLLRRVKYRGCHPLRLMVNSSRGLLQQQPRT